MAAARSGTGKPASAGKSATRESWTAAALSVIAEAGVGAVAVEPLAKRLGVTKGSFYWHFETRDDLLRATLSAWETTSTDDVIRRMNEVASPSLRLRALLDVAHATTRGGRVELALSAAWDDPIVRPVIRRVTERRLAYLTECYAALGHPESRRAAMLALSSYLGLSQLARIGAMTAEERSAHAAYLAMALAPAEEQTGAREKKKR